MSAATGVRPARASCAVLLLGGVLLALSAVRPAAREGAALVVPPPVTGRWVVINGPGSRVPSHGVRAYGQAYAVDLLHPSPQDRPVVVGWGLGSRPEASSCWDAPVLATRPGRVVAVSDGRPDHRCRDTWPALLWMLTLEGFLRSLAGHRAVTGNHVVVDHEDGTWSLSAHLRRGSAAVAVGQRVEAGEVLGQVGNSGNTSEPHLHWQLMDHPDPRRAAGVAWTWTGVVDAGERDPRWSAARPPRRAPVAVDGVPPNGAVVEAAPVTGS